MTTQDTAQRPALRSQRMNLLTHSPRTKPHALVNAHAPVESRGNFARFVVSQYNDPELTAIFPDLPARCRTEAAKADLDTEVPQPVHHLRR